MKSKHIELNNCGLQVQHPWLLRHTSTMLRLWVKTCLQQLSSLTREQAWSSSKCCRGKQYLFKKIIPFIVWSYDLPTGLECPCYLRLNSNTEFLLKQYKTFYKATDPLMWIPTSELPYTISIVDVWSTPSTWTLCHFSINSILHFGWHA